MRYRNDPLETLDNLNEEEQIYLSNPDLYNFRPEAKKLERVDRRIDGEQYRFKVDKANEIITLAHDFHRPRYSLVEWGEDYSLIEARKALYIGESLETTRIHYLKLEEETFMYEWSEYTPTPVEIPEAFDMIDPDKLLEDAYRAPFKGHRFQPDKPDEPGDQTYRSVPPEEGSFFNE